MPPEVATSMTPQESTKRLCRQITALDLFKRGHLSQDALMRELREETLLDNPVEPTEDGSTGMRKLRCGLCHEPVATVSITIQPFVARCVKCLP